MFSENNQEGSFHLYSFIFMPALYNILFIISNVPALQCNRVNEK